MLLMRKLAHVKIRMTDRFFLHTKLQVVVGGCIWVAGLLIAGSDSPYMPWLNGVGAIVFSVASLFLGKMLSRLDSDAGACFFHERLHCSRRGMNEDSFKKPHDNILSSVAITRARIFSNF